MKFFVDTANLAQIKEAADLGVGVRLHRADLEFPNQHHVAEPADEGVIRQRG